MHRRTLGIALGTLAIAAAAGAVAAAAFVWSGVYDISATAQHKQPTYSFLRMVMLQSVRLRARNIEAPPLADAMLAQRGAVCFRDKCVQCHGAPGVAQDEIGLSMQPLPGPLIDAATHWKARELYWITRHGIKMSGMPAWQFRLPDEDLWALVAFLQGLPAMSTRDYHGLMASLEDRQCRR